MTGRWGAWGGLAVLVVGTVLAYQSAVFTSRSGDATPLYSTRRHDPYGTAALLDLLRERGIAATTLERPTLRPGDHGVLIQVLAGAGDDFKAPAFHADTEPLADWIAQGNTVVQLSRTPTALMTRLKIAGTEAMKSDARDRLERAENAGVAEADLPGALALARPAGTNAARLELRSPMTFAERPHDMAWTALARVPLQKNAIVAAEYRLGRGRLVLVGAPTPALNGSLGDAGNLDFVLNAAGKGPVLLDEWSHGIGHQATVIGFLVDAGLLPLLLQGAFVAGLYVWSTASPVASADDAPPRSRSAVEQIHTLAYLYARSLTPAAAYDRVQAELLRRLSTALGCKVPDVRARIGGLPAALRDRCRQLFDRLTAVRPPQDVRCLQCGYDLRASPGERCPECGTTVPPALRRRIIAADPSTADARTNERPDAVFAEILTRSHALAEEIRRERRARH